MPGSIARTTRRLTTNQPDGDANMWNIRSRATSGGALSSARIELAAIPVAVFMHRTRASSMFVIEPQIVLPRRSDGAYIAAACARVAAGLKDVRIVFRPVFGA